VIAHAFDDGGGSRVPNGEAFARATGGKGLAASRAVGVRSRRRDRK
jgi:hypothetical protein